MDYKIDTG